MFEDDDSVMGDLISVGSSKSKLDDSADDDIMDVDAVPIGRNKTSKKKAHTKAARIPLSPTRPATKRKGKGSRAKSKVVDTDNEFEGASQKRRKDIELPSSPIASKGGPNITSVAVTVSKSQSETQSFPAHKDSSVGLESVDNHDLSNSSPRPSQPSSPIPASSLAYPSLSSTAPTPASAHDTQSDQPPGVQNGSLRRVSEEESTDYGNEMDWNDGSSHDWNGGSGNANYMAVRHDKQQSRQDRCPSVAFDDICNKRRPALSSGSSVASSPGRSSSAEVVNSRIIDQSEAVFAPPADNQRPHPRPRPRPRIPKPGPSSVKWSKNHGEEPRSAQAGPSRAPGQTFIPVQLSQGHSHAATFSSNDRALPKRSR